MLKFLHEGSESTAKETLVTLLLVVSLILFFKFVILYMLGLLIIFVIGCKCIISLIFNNLIKNSLHRS